MSTVGTELEVIEIGEDGGWYIVVGTTSVSKAEAEMERWLDEVAPGEDWTVEDLRGTSREDWVWVPIDGTDEVRLDFASSDPEFHSGAETFAGVCFR